MQEFAVDRPTMLTIISMLDNNFILPSPKQPAFIMKTCHNGAESPSTGTCSVNEVTITLDAR